ncbi:RNase HII [Peptoniphilus asaccharolyticus DSM 20463]|uniref:Ribonuclease HII n=1 Tax=Peptoniphilus asaccharolyticus DSM 20463 TaxID=573058 RepID=A0A1W1UP88_PEPAS|nr:ribonuclease HII [Peptoniphilus asaccharolyticus]MBL7574976.1 ribonuclease HII [Peptoniphilus asaccharolyticus]SMB82819.1 RNase HII [Peptoniphilus asaccharolyticus DSM 20463]
MEEFEKDYKKIGYTNIVGIDEVGRGSLFGDVLACAIIMPDSRIEGVADSKKLSIKKRESLYEKILEECIAVGIGRVDSKKIDEINIKNATHLAMEKAVENMRDQSSRKVYADLLLIDAEKIDTQIAQVSIIKGDDRCYSIACASIVAKVYRDSLCNTWDEIYPGYNIKKNKGYGTTAHRSAIKEIGYTPMHRVTFLKNLIG